MSKRGKPFISETKHYKYLGFMPIGSMYGIFTYVPFYQKNQPNVGKYPIHGSYGHETILSFDEPGSLGNDPYPPLKLNSFTEKLGDRNQTTVELSRSNSPLSLWGKKQVRSSKIRCWEIFIHIPHSHLILPSQRHTKTLRFSKLTRKNGSLC